MSEVKNTEIKNEEVKNEVQTVENQGEVKVADENQPKESIFVRAGRGIGTAVGKTEAFLNRHPVVKFGVRAAELAGAVVAGYALGVKSTSGDEETEESNDDTVEVEYSEVAETEATDESAEYSE